MGAAAVPGGFQCLVTELHRGSCGRTVLGNDLILFPLLEQGMGQACSSGLEAVQAAVRACVVGASEASSSVAGSATELSRRLEQQAEASAASADTWTAACSSLCANITGAVHAVRVLVRLRRQGLPTIGHDPVPASRVVPADECGQQVEGMSALAVETESLLRQRLDVQRALAPPAQREFNVPSASALRELRCPSEDKLVARCHAEFPQVFAAGVVSWRARCAWSVLGWS